MADHGPSMQAKCIAEFIGTFMLVFSVGCNVITGNGTWSALSIGCTLMVVIYALAGVSGANFNPAVSVALGLAKAMPWPEVCIYCVVQIVAGIAAAFTYAYVLEQVFTLSPAPAYGWMEAGLAEILYTFMLCFVVLNVTCKKDKIINGVANQYYGLAIGFVVVAGAYAAGHISGGAFNPAVAIAIDLSSWGAGWCGQYVVCELIGAGLAAILFKLCRPDVDEYAQGTKLLSEFLGTYMLVVTVGLNVLGQSPAGALSIGSALMCMIYALGSVSGAHFNPAVTVALLINGSVDMPSAVGFILVQLVAGIAGALTFSAMEHGGTIVLGPGKGYGFAEALLAELCFTFLLAYVVLGTAAVKKYPKLSQYFGLAIGSCVTAGGNAIGAVSGGSLNPAVSTGASVSDFGRGGVDSLLTLAAYSGAELLGGILAALVFSVTHAGDNKGKVPKEPGIRPASSGVIREQNSGEIARP